MTSFTWPLLEEVRGVMCLRMENISTAKYARVCSVHSPNSVRSWEKHCKIQLDNHRKYSTHISVNEYYNPGAGDVLLISNTMLKSELDIRGQSKSCIIASVCNVQEDDTLVVWASSWMHTWKEPQEIVNCSDLQMQNGNEMCNSSGYYAFLHTNLATYDRVWYVLCRSLEINSKIIHGLFSRAAENYVSFAFRIL